MVYSFYILLSTLDYVVMTWRLQISNVPEIVKFTGIFMKQLFLSWAHFTNIKPVFAEVFLIYWAHIILVTPMASSDLQRYHLQLQILILFINWSHRLAVIGIPFVTTFYLKWWTCVGNKIITISNRKFHNPDSHSVCSNIDYVVNLQGPVWAFTWIAFATVSTILTGTTRHSFTCRPIKTLHYLHPPKCISL